MYIRRLAFVLVSLYSDIVWLKIGKNLCFGVKKDKKKKIKGITSWRTSRKNVCMSLRSYFHFRAITRVNVSGLSPNSLCALILWRSGLGLLMGKFRLFLTELYSCDMSVFSFPDNNFSKYQWIFTKLGVCFNFVETWFGISDGKILSIFDELSASNTVIIFYFKDNNLSKSQWIFTKVNMCFYIVEICFSIAQWQILSIFDRVICP